MKGDQFWRSQHKNVKEKCIVGKKVSDNEPLTFTDH